MRVPAANEEQPDSATAAEDAEVDRLEKSIHNVWNCAVDGFELCAGHVVCALGFEFSVVRASPGLTVVASGPILCGRWACGC
jgi:hypothetical protein